MVHPSLSTDKLPLQSLFNEQSHEEQQLPPIQEQSGTAAPSNMENRRNCVMSKILDFIALHEHEEVEDDMPSFNLDCLVTKLTPQKPPQPKFACPACRKGFGAKKSLSKHILTTHINTVTFNCSKCKKSFPLAASCKRHEKTCKQEAEQK